MFTAVYESSIDSLAIAGAKVVFCSLWSWHVIIQHCVFFEKVEHPTIYNFSSKKNYRYQSCRSKFWGCIHSCVPDLCKNFILLIFLSGKLFGHHSFFKMATNKTKAKQSFFGLEFEIAERSIDCFVRQLIDGAEQLCFSFSPYLHSSCLRVTRIKKMDISH